ncbi:hypothetical protein Tco_0218938 [Tanacetum coccineum]
MTRVDSLENDLKQTKLTMGSAIVKLVKKVKKLEGILKKRNVVSSDSEEEESRRLREGKNQNDPLVSLYGGLRRELGIGSKPTQTLQDISQQHANVTDSHARVRLQLSRRKKKPRDCYLSSDHRIGILDVDGGNVNRGRYWSDSIKGVAVILSESTCSLSTIYLEETKHEEDN